MHFQLSPFILWNALWIVNTYSGFQVSFFSDNRDYKMAKFLHEDNNNDAKTVTIPWVFR